MTIEIGPAPSQNGAASAALRVAHNLGSMPESEAKRSVAGMFRLPLLARAFAAATATIAATPAPALAQTFVRRGDTKGEPTDAKHTKAG